MKSFSSHITEARGVKEKGWANKSGKLVMTRIRPPYYPYHLQMIVMKPRVFGTTKEQINKHIKSHWDVRAHGSPKDKDKNLDILWDKALAGKIDREVTIEEFVMKQGWSRVVIDDGSSSIENVHITERQMHKIAKSIDKNYGSSVLFPESSAFFELTGKEFSEVIYNKLDWDYYIKTGKYTAPKRSEIGSTMAQFREEEEEMKSFRNYITEVLDRPLKWKEFIKKSAASGYPGTREASFDVGEYGYNIRVLIPKNPPNQMKTIGVEFTLGSEGGVSKGQGQKHDILNTGNAGAVFATVIDYIKHVVKDEKVERILFSGKERSRRSLYNAMLRRMKKMGIIKRFDNNGDSFDAYVGKVK